MIRAGVGSKTLKFTGKKRYRCGCDDPTVQKLSFVKKNAVVYVRNRHYNGKRKLFRPHGCVLKKNKYYLAEYSVYKCEVCCKEIYVQTGYKRITKEEADNSGLRTMNLFILSEQDAYLE